MAGASSKSNAPKPRKRVEAETGFSAPTMACGCGAAAPPPHHHHHYPPQPHPYHHPHPWTTGGRYTYGGPMLSTPPPYVEHQKTITIRNDVNLKKESLKLDSDPDNPGLLSFSLLKNPKNAISQRQKKIFCHQSPLMNYTNHCVVATIYFDPGEISFWHLLFYCSFDRHALELLEKMLVLDPSQRISAKDALDAEYFWTDPLPCDPKRRDLTISGVEKEALRNFGKAKIT